MAHFAAFTLLRFVCDEVNEGPTFVSPLRNGRYVATNQHLVVNMDRVLTISHSCADADIRASVNRDPGLLTSEVRLACNPESENVVLVATQEIEAWLADNPQFGGRSTLHLIKPEGN